MSSLRKLLEDDHNGQASSSLANGNGSKSLFQRAHDVFQPGPLFQTVVYLYGERKLFVFFLLHTFATLVTWAHFAYIKWNEQQIAVPDGAPYYWPKVLVPTIEFGSMHAILLQMALIPLTMSRLSIASLTNSFVDRFVPLNRMLRIHIHLGYVMVGIVFFATVLFFIFFGTLCAGGQQDFCDKLVSEIMFTGLGIMACLLIILVTSYFRHHIPYEVFYAIHHLVFAMYAITIAHTFDDVQRNNERNRSQTFQWFSTTILWYFCDRAAMHLNHKYKLTISSKQCVQGKDGSRIQLIKVPKPALFNFQPGQYAFLRVPSIDKHQWHPFSIASCPSGEFLEFYMETFSPNSWTGQLWETGPGTGIEIMGPYGTSLAGQPHQFSNGLAIGAGTGIVPILSIFKRHVRQMLRLSPRVHLELQEENRSKRLEYERETELRKGSLAGQCLKNYQENHGHSTRADELRKSIHRSLEGSPETTKKSPSEKEMRAAAFHATKSLYGVVYSALLTTLGLVVGALTVSWNTQPFDLHSNMVVILQLLAIVFQFCYGIVAIFMWDMNTLWAFVDVASLIIAGLSDYYWYTIYEDHGTLRAVDLTSFCFLTGYMVARLWTKTVAPRHTSWKHAPGDEHVVSSMESLKVIWVARSACLVAEIIPDIEEIWQEVLNAWGYEDAIKVCQITVYCTDKNEIARQSLMDQVAGTALKNQNRIRFGRPDFADVIESHTIELTEKSRSSNSLLAFCGSPQLAQFIHSCKVQNDIAAAITGNKQHQMEFISENYGGVKKPKGYPTPQGKLTTKDLKGEKVEDASGSTTYKNDSDHDESLTGTQGSSVQRGTPSNEEDEGTA